MIKDKIDMERRHLDDKSFVYDEKHNVLKVLKDSDEDEYHDIDDLDYKKGRHQKMGKKKKEKSKSCINEIDAIHEYENRKFEKKIDLVNKLIIPLERKDRRLDIDVMYHEKYLADEIKDLIKQREDSIIDATTEAGLLKQI
jgi:hypothetical protein